MTDVVLVLVLSTLVLGILVLIRNSYLVPNL